MMSFVLVDCVLSVIAASVKYIARLKETDVYPILLLNS